MRTQGEIVISGIRAWGYHGLLPAERERGQIFVVDVAIWSDMPYTDQLADTMDYAGVAALVHTIIAGDPVNLIETLAQRIADAVLETIASGVVAITVHKPQAPIPVDFSDVAVTVTRRKDV